MSIHRIIKIATLLSLGIAGTAQAQIVNGSFETGNFSGWTLIGYGGVQGASYSPTDGIRAGVITTGGSASPSTIASLLGTGPLGGTAGSALSQIISADAGTTITFDYRFVCNDYMPFDDFAGVAIDGQVIILGRVENCDGLGGGPPGFEDANPWATYTHTFNTSGSHTVGFFVLDLLDTAVDSGLVIDRFEIANNEPVAVCTDLTLDADASCQACGDVDGGSYDPDGDAITMSTSPGCNYGLGTSNVTLLVTDEHGASNSCNATVTVQDVTPPSDVDVSAIQYMSFPRSWALEDFHLSDCAAIVADNCDVALDIDTYGTITAIDSDELTTAGANHDCELDPEPCIDMKILGNSHFQIRNTRDSYGNGRVYTVHFTVADSAGNQSVEHTCQYGVRLWSAQVPVAGPPACTLTPGEDPESCIP